MNTSFMLAAAVGSSGSFAKQLFSVLFTLILFLVILYLAYLSSKWIGKRYTAGNGQKNIHVLEAVSLSQSQSLRLVEVGGKYMLLGVTKDQITYLSEVDPQTLTLTEHTSGSGGEPLDFAKTLKQAVQSRFGGASKPPEKEEHDDAADQ